MEVGCAQGSGWKESMMPKFRNCLVTFFQAKEQLQVDHDLDDAIIDRMRANASGDVLDYIKIAETPGLLETYIDALGEPVEDVIPEPVVTATLLVIGALYENRDGDSWRSPQPLSQAVMDVLVRQRDMTMA